MSGMNFFIIKNGTLVTPTLTGTILEGVTRSSLIRIARDHGLPVEERTLSLTELIQGIQSHEITEAFACGTAVIVTPISSFGEEDGTIYEIKPKDTEYNLQGRIVKGPVSLFLKERLLSLQEGRSRDPYGWRVQVPSSVDSFIKTIPQPFQESHLEC